MASASRVQRRRRRAESGFTLIELLVVIAILGVLAGIVIFNVTGVTDRGAVAACNTEINTVQTAVDTYRNSPPPVGDLDPSGRSGPVPAITDLDKPGGLLNSAVPSACATLTIDGSGHVTGTPK
jgi:general secretion pathway protein G